MSGMTRGGYGKAVEWGLRLQASQHECDTERKLLRKADSQLWNLCQRHGENDEIGGYVRYCIANLDPLDTETFRLDPRLPCRIHGLALQSLC